MTDRHVLFDIDLDGKPQLIGRLWGRVRNGRESATFEYDSAWLKHPQRFPLEPALVLGKGPLHTVAGRRIFGAIGDSAPDRWGRVLIQRDERRKAREENRGPHTLGEIDYLLAVGDTAPAGRVAFRGKGRRSFFGRWGANSAPYSPLRFAQCRAARDSR
jgi:serine/threonine-protein kinase HipA